VTPLSSPFSSPQSALRRCPFLLQSSSSSFAGLRSRSGAIATRTLRRCLDAPPMLGRSVPFVVPQDDSKKGQGLSCKKTATRPIQPVHGPDSTAGNCARRGHAPWSRY
jgi:hypothetical protein